MTGPPKVRADSLVVSEIFGPTFQGEGSSAGRLAGFLRLGLCNLTCEWCDTAYTWDWHRYDPGTELRRLPLAAVAENIRALDVPLLVVTGGEPLIQQAALSELLAALPGLEVEVETNGTVIPDPALVERVTKFNVSPKLSSSGVHLGKRLRAAPLEALRRCGKCQFKFVVREPRELAEVREVVDRFALRPVYVMPEGTTATEILDRSREIAPAVLSQGWNLTTRLHVLLWNDRRGV